MNRILAYYRAKALKANAGRYYDAMVHNCARVSANNGDLAFAVHRRGVFGGPVVEQIQRPGTVQLSESDDCVIVKDGNVYELRRERP